MSEATPEQKIKISKHMIMNANKFSSDFIKMCLKIGIREKSDIEIHLILAITTMLAAQIELTYDVSTEEKTMNIIDIITKKLIKDIIFFKNCNCEKSEVE
jgi:hypothetical protein